MYVILLSLYRANIFINLIHKKQCEGNMDALEWLIEDIRHHGASTDKTVVYCR